jgi:hypothetical protein
VEAVLRAAAATQRCGIVWVTHDEQQPYRVGGKVLTLPQGGPVRGWRARGAAAALMLWVRVVLTLPLRVCVCVCVCVPCVWGARRRHHQQHLL